MSSFASLLTRTCYPIINRNQRFTFCSISRELIRQQKKEAPVLSNQDVLLGTIKSSSTTENVLKLVNTHVSIMNNKHLLQVLRSIFTLQKNGESGLSTSQILKHRDFERLCLKLKQNAGAIELNETIEALKVVCYMGVNADSTIAQVLMQVIRKQINQLTIQQIIFVDFLLSQISPTPLSEALLMALPIVFEVNLKTKLDRHNLVMVAECLQFSAKRSLPEHTIEFLTGIILSHGDNFDPKMAMSVLWSVCDLPPDVFFENIIDKMINIMLVHVDSFNWKDLETTIGKMIQQYSQKFPFYHHEIFCDMCVNHLIDNDLGFANAAYLMRRLNKAGHISEKLLDYICTKVHEDPSIIERNDPLILTSIIYGMGTTEYKPVHWDQFKSLIEKTDNLSHETRKEILWMKLASSLCALDIFKPDVLKIALRPTYINRLFKQGYISDFENLMFIYQVIMTQRKDLIELLPNNSIIEKCVTKLKPMLYYVMEGALKEAFGANCVRTNMFNDLYQQLDYVIIMDKDGNPVDFPENNKTTALHDLTINPEHQVVVILGLQNFHLTSNLRTLRTPVAINNRLLESKGYVVVPIILKNWLELEDFEKVPYLVEQVNSKFNLDRISSVN